MEKWDFEKIDFEGCLNTSEAIEKYLSFKENNPNRTYLRGSCDPR